MKKISLLLTSISLWLWAQSAWAYSFASSTGLDYTAKKTGHYNQRLFGASTGGDLTFGINSILATALSFLGVIFLIMMIYAGILWMTARGNEKRVDTAKTMLADTIVGIIIVAAAYAISYFVTSLMVAQTLVTQ